MVGVSFALAAHAADSSLGIAGLTVTPHVMAESMRYARAPEPAVGARVQLFLRNGAASNANPLIMEEQTRLRFDGKSPAQLLAAKDWSWHDMPSATPGEKLQLPPGALTVWTFNSRVARFGPGGRARVEAGPEGSPWLSTEISFDKPDCWLSAITFFAPDSAIQPDVMVVHIANASSSAVEIRSCRLWLPQNPKSPRVLLPQPPLQPLDGFNGHTTISAGDRGGFSVKTGPLPLTYTVVEVTLARAGGDASSLWAYLRIKPERFDISGGWVNGPKNSVAKEPFLKALKRLYVNAAHLQITPGYSDTELYDRYPLKYFGAMTPFETYDTDAMLPKIHAVEFLGEPQYGGGHPVPPQDVWEKLHPYATTRLATTVTHSEERIWRDYAGLSDFPHYDAYRVTAPSADAWRRYERWGKKRIGWGAPLETIGDMCRSLRELNRPMPCAIWSQGPHEEWEVYGGRKRVSPTPDEIHLQAYHAISTRITSLYWFNLSLKTLVDWRDTLDELGRIGRELRMIDEFLLEGDAYRFERLTRGQNQLDWDIASVCGPRAALLFALDLDYAPDPEEKVFRFGPPRDARWRFPLPAYLQGVADVFRMDADGVYDTTWSIQDGAVEIQENTSRVAVYLATPDKSLRAYLEGKRQKLIATEAALQFDPARNDADFNQLVQLSESAK
ncbi:MAG: hypothetical protein NTZ09_19700 [Candidatus Hydrogenedentes bacterium]|nr:hypothetical protein [Candidatus Hydrogenedentota bacterium]